MAEPEFKAPEGCLYTQSTDGKRLYLHLLTYPFKYLIAEGLADRIEYAQFLHDGSEIIYKTDIPSSLNHPQGGNTVAADGRPLVFHIPEHQPACRIPVIEIFLK